MDFVESVLSVVFVVSVFGIETIFNVSFDRVTIVGLDWI
jgi:hypothetical protein